MPVTTRLGFHFYILRISRTWESCDGRDLGLAATIGEDMERECNCSQAARSVPWALLANQIPKKGLEVDRRNGPDQKRLLAIRLQMKWGIKNRQTPYTASMLAEYSASAA